MAEEPPAVVNLRSTLCTDSEGEVATHDAAEEQTTVVATTPPKLAVVEPTTNPVPVTLTTVPPPTGPALGLTAVTVGTLSYTNLSLLDVADVPNGVVTVRSTVPAPLCGAVTVIELVELTVTPVPEVPPNDTCEAPMKFVPVTVTTVPPASGPDLGLTPEIEGEDS